MKFPNRRRNWGPETSNKLFNIIYLVSPRCVTACVQLVARWPKAGLSSVVCIIFITLVPLQHVYAHFSLQPVMHRWLDFFFPLHTGQRSTQWVFIQSPYFAFAFEPLFLGLRNFASFSRTAFKNWTLIRGPVTIQAVFCNEGNAMPTHHYNTFLPADFPSRTKKSIVVVMVGQREWVLTMCQPMTDREKHTTTTTFP